MVLILTKRDKVLWLYRSKEAEVIRRLDVNNLLAVWQLLPGDLKLRWKYIHLTEQESLMYYDLFKQGFAYHSDESFVSHNVLNAVAMKYVNTYFCKDFFLDELFIEENEITYKSPLFAIFNEIFFFI